MNRSVQTILDTTKATNSEKPGLITIVAKTSEKSTKTRVRVPGDFDYSGLQGYYRGKYRAFPSQK